MIYVPPPAPPQQKPDALMQALSPESAMAQRQKVEQIMRKYGQEMPGKTAPAKPRQWVGDNNA